MAAIMAGKKVRIGPDKTIHQLRVVGCVGIGNREQSEKEDNKTGCNSYRS
jgi:hypothetical protein